MPLEQYLPEAMRLTLQLNHPVYDNLYLALAKRFGELCRHRGHPIREAVASHGTHVGHIRLVAMIRGTRSRMYRGTSKSALR